MIPNTIKIGHAMWTIDTSKESSDRLCNDGCRGKTYKDKFVICIDGNLPFEAQMETLLHEVLHACFHFIGASDKKLEEEDLVTALAPILLTVLKENPDILNL